MNNFNKITYEYETPTTLFMNTRIIRSQQRKD